MKALWAHLVVVRTATRRIGRRTELVRTTMIVHGLFNQLFALFASVDLAKLLGRRLIVGSFHVCFRDKKDKVPLSRVVDLNSILTPTQDWSPLINPVPSSVSNHLSPPVNWVSSLQKECHIPDLEVGCCFSWPVPGHNRDEHIRHLRFHPFFYQLTAPFRSAHPTYQVVHYRMEDDFTRYFFRQWGYATLQQCRQTLHTRYQEAMQKHLDPSIPTLIVSHYYKDPKQQRDHDLQWPNLIHFSLSPQQRNALCTHLRLPPSTPMREVDAILDFILCDNTPVFIGCGGSTFSGSVCARHPRPFLVQPV